MDWADLAKLGQGPAGLGLGREQVSAQPSPIVQKIGTKRCVFSFVVA